MGTEQAFDFVIVGGGAAGAVLANRLATGTTARVLLLEAGPDIEEARIADPERWASLQGTELDWDFRTSPQPELKDRVVRCPRGRMLGGSTSMNAMVWIRGDRRDFDSWGIPGWGSEELWPAFERAESVDESGTGFRMTRREGRHPWCRSFVQAAEESGFPFVPDFHQGQLTGVGYYSVTAWEGRRQSAKDAYLTPAAGRPNLTVRTGAEVSRLVIHGDRVTGVEYRRGGTSEVVGVTHEVLLAAGAVGSPHLLFLSGVGPAGRLRELGLDQHVDLPGVGENLHDHIALSVAFTAADADPAASRSGLGEAGLFAGDRHHVWLGPSTDADGRFFSLAVGLTHPASRGRLVWQADRSPVPDPGYLSSSADLEDLAEGVSLIVDLAHTAALRPLWGGAPPEVLKADRATVADYVRHSAGTQFHLVGTCRMGTDDLAVVAPDLRVRGLANVRVADVSVLPEITTGGPQAPAYAVAEQAAELICVEYSG
ncbi:choline dehydrogenase [Sinosporangium album]|uniref:Choline dehydrogenase n=1 Tax=Sinosporangium album TaxID=504805 RepID=A0A1G7YQX8_9ACTN|nr:GMC family oxidoreductase N-terminal domain-containing protein [Sinosporangium album]SDG98972.1 choline dehydrogenase [Sinosporangium album]